MESKKYEPVIGLEVHVELKTKSKMFCGCKAYYFGKEPNTHVCPVCLGLPGALPVPNKKAVEWCILIGLALNCKIPPFSKFDRKNYFYPDLPKGYQISQYDKPFCVNGHIDVNSKRIRIRRVHMEEDTGKLTHGEVDGDRVSLIDFNRSGVPLVEIVTEPDFESSKEVVEYLKKLQQIVRYLGVSNANMEKGEMRLEPNISLKVISNKQKATSNQLPKYKVEVKNINSFRFVEKAIEYEIKRQAELLEKLETPAQETRGWSEVKQKTAPQRTKEDENDYRYFPEPDIPPLQWKEFQISNAKFQMPEMPIEKLNRFQKEYRLSAYDAEIITREREAAEYFEKAAKTGDKENIAPKQIANVIINKKISTESMTPEELVKHIKRSTSDISNELSKEEISMIEKIISGNQKVVEDYKTGKEKALMFILGQVMRNLKRKINPLAVKQAMIDAIK